MASTHDRSVIWSVQYLRAAAAIAVVVFHALQDRGSIFQVGAHGVDLFFCISGFIMVALTDGRGVTPKDFALDRIARIVPSYWLATALTFAMAWAGVHFFGRSSDWELLGKSLMFIPAWNEHGQLYPTLFLGWTLNVEMFFYALFAATLFVKRHNVIWLAGGLVALVVVGGMFKPGGAIARSYTSPLLLEFLAGALLGRLFGIGLTNRSERAQILGVVMLGLALILTGLQFSRLLFGAAAVLILGTGLLLERRGRMPRIRWLKELGDASFAIYLYQQLVFEVVRIAAETLSHATVNRDPPASLVQAVSIVATVLSGIWILRHVESPLTRAVKLGLGRLDGRSVRRALSTAVARPVDQSGAAVR